MALSTIPGKTEAVPAIYRIATSIRPLAGIATAITDGSDIQVEALLDGHTSPRDAVVKPSYVNAVRGADLVLIVHLHFERFLDDTLEDYGGTKVMQAANLQGVRTSSQRGFEIVDPDTYMHIDDDTQNADTTDYHLWLDPRNALSIAAALRDRLSQSRPDEAATFASNYRHFAQTVASTQDAITQRLARISARPYIADRDDFQYFDRSFTLRQTAMIRSDSDDEVNPDRITALGTIAQQRQVACIVYSSGDMGTGVKQMAEQSKLPAIPIDPMGAEITISPDYYPQLLSGIADQFARCLNNTQAVNP